MRKQFGLAALEVMLILLALGIIAGTGWYVWHSTNSAKDLYSKTSSLALPKTGPIKSFDDCKKAAGSKVEQTSPEVCVTKDGKRFTGPATEKSSNTEQIATAIAEKCHSNNPSLNEYKVKSANLSVFSISKDNLIVDGNFAGANGICGESVQPGGGVGFLFKKTNNIWAFVYEGQQQPDCAAIDNQGWPVSVLKMFDGSCYDSATQTYRAPK